MGVKARLKWNDDDGKVGTKILCLKKNWEKQQFVGGDNVTDMIQ